MAPEGGLRHFRLVNGCTWPLSSEEQMESLGEMVGQNFSEPVRNGSGELFVWCLFTKGGSEKG